MSHLEFGKKTRPEYAASATPAASEACSAHVRAKVVLDVAASTSEEAKGNKADPDEVGLICPFAYFLDAKRRTRIHLWRRNAPM
jgi:hypothetical protein